MSEGEQGQMKLQKRLETTRSWVLPVMRKVQPEISVDEGELEELRVALSRIGCAGLLDMPWEVREEGVIRDLIGLVINT